MNDPDAMGLQDQLDLLAEGELNVAEREQLFTQLDRDPISWKRATFALLEVQALQRHLSVKELAPSKTSSVWEEKTPSRQHKISEKRWRDRVRWRLLGGTLAAIAFVAIGMALNENLRSPITQTVVSQPVEPLHPLVQQMADYPLEWTRQLTLTAQSVANQESQLIAFVAIENQGQPQVYPIVENQAMQKQLADQASFQLPTELVSSIEQAGWQINVQRQLLSFRFPDGVNQIIPIEMLDCHFLGKEVF